jgi:hypothetical protein
VTPTARSLKVLRERGYTPAKVEYFNPGTRRLHDLFGFIDLVALEPGCAGLLAIQSTSDNGGNVSARVTKMAQEPRAALWLACGNRVMVHGWAKRGARGKRKVWTLREITVTADDLVQPSASEAP